MLNLLASKCLFKIDLTESKLYTLSSGSKKIVNKIPETVNVKVVVSPDVPAPYNSSVKYFIDLLKEYAKYSKNKITVEVISSEDTSFLDAKAELYSIPPLQVNAIEKDNLQIKKIYMGAAFIYKDKKEDIPVIANVENMEYEISSIMKNLIVDRKPKIAVLEAGNAPNARQGLSRLYSLLSKNYEVESVKVGEGKTIDKKYDVIMLISPQTKLADYEVYAIQEFIMSGKSVVLAVDVVSGSPRSGYAYSLDMGLEDFLKTNGIILKKQIIFDANASVINVSNNQGGFMLSTSLRYPFFPEIYNFNKNNVITKDLSAINLIYPTPIETNSDNTTEKDLTYMALAKSSENTGLEDHPYNIAIERSYSRTDFDKGPQIVALLVEGKFKSNFNKPLKGYTDTFKNEGSGKLLLISDGDFIKDQYIMSGNNRAFVLNALDYFMADPELAVLRGKLFTYNPITISNASTQQLLKYISIILPILLSVLVIFIVGKILKMRRHI
jgi:ABC-2 type transport system permease protein